MKRVLKNYRLPENVEVLFMLTLGMVLQTTDGSPFTIKNKWTTVWDTELPAEYFSPFIQQCIKTILSGIVVGRCLLTYFYVMSAVLVMFCIMRESTPSLLLIWLVVSGIKSICMTIVEALTGIYVCSAFGKVRKVCIEFFISKALEITFAAYLWGSVMNIYQNILAKNEKNLQIENWEEYMREMRFKRPHAARSLLDESTLYKTARLNNFEFKDVPEIILQMLKREEEMSQDSLLGPGMMLASVSNMGSFDDLKISQSLGELGLLDLKSVRVMNIDEGEILSPSERALRFLKLNWSDVREAKSKRKKRIPVTDIFQIDDQIWENVMSDQRTGQKRPTRTRPEIVLQNFINFDDDLSRPLEVRRKSLELKFGFSLFSFIREKNEMQIIDEDPSLTFLDDGDSQTDEDGLAPLFMSNIREEAAVNRIRMVSRKVKGNAYAQLIKQEYMTIIGPEVFDRAPRLTNLNSPSAFKPVAKPSPSLPNFKKKRVKRKIIFDNESGEYVSNESDDASLVSYESVRRSSNSDSKDSSAAQRLKEVLVQLKEYTELPEKTADDDDDTEDQAEQSRELLHECDEYHCPSDECDEYRCPNDESDYGSKRTSACSMISPSKCETPDDRGCDTPVPESTCWRRKIKIRRTGTRVCPTVSSDESNETCDDSRGDDDNDDRPQYPRQSPYGSCMSPGDESSCRDDSEAGSDGDGGECLGDENDRGCTWKQNDSPGYKNTKLTYSVASVINRGPFANFQWDGTEKRKTQVQAGLGNVLTERRIKTLPRDLSKMNSTDTLFKLPKRGRDKVWKSEVLKTLATYKPKQPNSKTRILPYVTSDLVGYIKNCPVPDKDQGTKEPTLSEPPKIPEKQSNDGNKSPDTGFSNTNSNFSVELNRQSKISIDFGSIGGNSNEEKSEEVGEGGETEYSVNPVENIPEEYYSPDEMEEEFTHADGMSQSGETMKKVEFFDEVQEVPAGPILGFDEYPYERESEESFSLYYSKDADLASPLLDMKRFIYPDHIHYSYKHVNKKGFDVNINGGLPLLVRESLTMSTPIGVKNVAATTHNPDMKITRKPMDLSFATSHAFAEWQSPEQSDANVSSGDKGGREVRSKEDGGPRTDKSKHRPSTRDRKSKKSKTTTRRSIGRSDLDVLATSRLVSLTDHSNDLMQMCPKTDYYLVQKLVKMCRKMKEGRDGTDSAKSGEREGDRPPIQISSTQLHSNKGRINSTYNPAISLNENKTRAEKKKAETPEKRTKDMFARLEREVLFHSRTQKSFVG